MANCGEDLRRSTRIMLVIMPLPQSLKNSYSNEKHAQKRRMLLLKVESIGNFFTVKLDTITLWILGLTKVKVCSFKVL